MRGLAATIVALVWLLTSGSARAQPRVRPIDDPQDSDFIATTERDEDPLGIDGTTRQKLDEAADAHDAATKHAASHPKLPVVQGEVLRGIGALRESAHEAQIRWAHGVQYVTARTTLHNASRFAAEASYRFALVEGARPLSLRLCQDTHCQEASVRHREPGRERYLARLEETSAAPQPALSGEWLRDERGDALTVRVAPLLPDASVQIEVSYAVEAPVRGGRVRLTLPSRGQDPRAALATVRISGSALTLPELLSELEVEAWLPLEIVADFTPAQAALTQRTRAPCGQHTCERSWRARPLRDADRKPIELWVLVDRSPSMEGPARGHVVPTLRALLQAAPESSLLRLGVFDSTADALTEQAAPREAPPLQALQRALSGGRAARSRLSSGLSLALGAWRPASRLPVVLAVITDGRLTVEPQELRAAARWQRERVPSFVIDVEGGTLHEQRQALLRAAGAERLAVGALARRATVRGELEPLAERLSAVAHARADTSLSPGEQRVSYTRSPATRAPRAAAPSQWLRPDQGRYWLASLGKDPEAGLAPQDLAFYPSVPFLPSATDTKAADTALPSESVLQMLRGQLLPKARACLRRDRAGRGDYAVHATFRFVLERRELLEAEVEGELEPPLRQCLNDILGALRVPFFSGRVRVSYPIYTEREPPPPRIELTADVAAQIDDLFDREPGTLP